ncbi:MAG: endolytic transglycosylase MltG [Niameybacter sp.]|uniref:endolytic transglycosylase MltG n=1 Tax=Niameybacter sp. TaxID=2033640 RepID=UPI002FC9C20F
MKKHKNAQRKIYNLLFCMFLLVLAACGGVIAFSKSFDYSFDMINENSTRPTSSTIRELPITIDQHTTIENLAQILYEQGFIGNKFWFLLEAKLYNYADQLIPGTYRLSSTMTNIEMLKFMTRIHKEETAISFTIPEGFTVEQIANRLDDKKIVAKEDFIRAVNEKTYDYTFLQNISTDTKYRLEGYLFPDTYTVYPDTSSEEIIMMMLNRFEEISNLYTTHLYDSNYTLHDIVRIASIIEHEAKLEEERPIISGVIYNRLQQDMPLQMCSTVQYAMEKRKKVLTAEDLSMESTYNTYLHTGLPIGPICSPGESSLRAAFLPENNDYFYFVLKDATEGSHAFSSTADEHAAYKAQYKQSQDVNFTE